MIEDFFELADDPQELFLQVSRQLVEEGDFHGLFDLRILQSRHELGLPVRLHAAFDEQDEQETAKLEQGYLDACREVGQLFLEASLPLEAWRYLRPTGEKKGIRAWLARTVPEEHNADQLIELALHERIDPERGYAWLLARRGTCQAVTELEMMQAHLSLSDQRACAAVLVRHLHEELLANICNLVQEPGQTSSSDVSFSQWLETHSEVLSNQAPLVDVSHLAATVRFARLLTEHELLDLAIDLASYGSLLADDFIYPDPEPFEDIFKTHHLLFCATRGDDPEEALQYFGNRAHKVEREDPNLTAVEVYLELLLRCNRSKQALAEYDALVPSDRSLSSLAPSLLELAGHQGNWQKYFEICRSRGDIIGFAAGKLRSQCED